MLRNRDSCGYDEDFENTPAEKKQKLAVNGSSSNGTHNGVSVINGGAPIFTKEETLKARKKFIA